MPLSLSSLNIKQLAVIGAGQMGTGIAYVAALEAKIPKVILYDENKDQLAKQNSFINNLLEKALVKRTGKITESDVERVKSTISFTNSFSDMSDSDFCIEAIPEVLELKIDLLKRLSSPTFPSISNSSNESFLSRDAIIATNTSSISITRLASHVREPKRFIGMHFMNPVPVMPLVEVIKGYQTDNDTLEKTIKLAELMKKTTTISADTPGFVANRLLMPYINEACFTLYEVR